MLNSRLRGALVVLAASAGLGACTALGPYGGVGVGVGSQYGYGSPYGYGYGDPYSYYNGYGRYPYYGWYDGFYYPGAGYWVYDPGGHPHPITDRQRNYFSNLLKKFREERGAQASAEVKENWSGFRTRSAATATGTAPATGSAEQRSIRQIGEARSQAQVERQQRVRAERQQAVTERQQARSERQEAFRQQVLERREARRASKPTDE